MRGDVADRLGRGVQHSLVASEACQEPTENPTPALTLLLQRAQVSSRGQAQVFPKPGEEALTL